MPTSALKALARLKAGNARFVENQHHRSSDSHPEKRDALVGGQEPFAIILGCSDSRVPAEIVFDQGLGDLFVIRVAGNIVAPSQIGSVEFAAETFGTKLVVVMGHTKCGAIAATVDELQRDSAHRSVNLRAIVNRIRPSVESLLALKPEREALIKHATHANIRASVNQLQHGSEILESLVEQKKLLIVGAEYAIETGIVTFFDNA